MKILILSNEYPVDFLGGGQVIRNISKGLSGLGHTVELYSPSDYFFLADEPGLLNDIALPWVC